jgi:hypothetical protein
LPFFFVWLRFPDSTGTKCFRCPRQEVTPLVAEIGTGTKRWLQGKKATRKHNPQGAVLNGSVRREDATSGRKMNEKQKVKERDVGKVG